MEIVFKIFFFHVEIAKTFSWRSRSLSDTGAKPLPGGGLTSLHRFPRVSVQYLRGSSASAEYKMKTVLGAAQDSCGS